MSHRRTHRRACHLCEAICGVVIETEGDRILSIKGDPDDPLSRGHICPKAVALQDIHDDPDRLRRPVQRVTDDNGESHWQEISWHQALNTTARRLVETLQQHGADAIGIYTGNPVVHNYGMATHQGELFRHIRTRNRFSATSVDQLPHHLASLWLFGHKFLLPVVDIDRCDYLLMLGANPLASNGSLWTVPDVKRRIHALRRRGGKLVLIDPRRSETAAQASEHLFIRPGSDVLFLLALLQHLFAQGLANPDRLSAFTVGLEAVAEAVARFTPEFAAARTGIPANTVRRLAEELANASAGACYGRMGVSTQAHGTLCQWLIQLINVATGNLDRPGGVMFTSPAVDLVAASGPGGFGRSHSRVRGLPEYDRELPVAALAEEISTPGEGQVRALFTGAGNPVLSTPNGRQLEQALQQLDFMVSLDPYINETTRHADIILPPTSPLEHDHYDLSFHVLSVRNTARYNEPVFDKPEGSLHDWEIYTELGQRVAALLGVDAAPGPAPDQIVDGGLRAGVYAAQGLNLDTLKQHPSGLDLGPLQSQLPDRLATADKTIRCDHPTPMAALAHLEDTLQEPAPDTLYLIGRRHVRSNNSWMHNYRRLVKGPGRCTLKMHPADIGRRGLADGGEALLTSRVGTVKVRLEATDEMMPGVVSLPHGWGHHRAGTRMRIAQAHAGVSCNDVTDHQFLDTISGNAALNGLVVTVTACTQGDASPA